MIQVLLVINYFNQPYYSYGEKSILAVFCALFPSSEQKVCVSVFWFDRVLLINQEWVLVSEKQAKEAHRSFKHKSYT